jgi:hypothetical protein
LKTEPPKGIFRRPDDKYIVDEAEFSKNSKVMPDFKHLLDKSEVKEIEPE